MGSKHYDIILLIHPNHSDDIQSIINKQKESFSDSGADVYRVEDWGRKKLHYPIENVAKAHFLCFSVTMSGQNLKSLDTSYKLNDLVVRHLIVEAKEKLTDQSPMKIVEQHDGNKKSLLAALVDHPERQTFKNIAFCQEHVSPYSGRINPRRQTLLSAQDQKKLTNAIKLNRFLALMPYCDKHNQ
ncbi:MAG: 30S ribosomal protein S6 [Candidatus Comchoanobacterales bacterium]